MRTNVDEHLADLQTGEHCGLADPEVECDWDFK